jgi:putative heme-binding domain-containing protein
VLACWDAAGPLPAGDAPRLLRRLEDGPPAALMPEEKAVRWRLVYGEGTDLRVRLGPAVPPDAVWLAYTDLRVPGRTAVQFLGGSGAPLRVWLNGKPVYERGKAGPFRADADRFDAVLAAGSNRLVVQLGAGRGPAEFHLRFRRKGSKAEHEKLTQAALSRAGDAERGRRLFFDAKKSQCVKCHRIGEQGERIGPELTGIGSRFSRIHLVESILEPSRTVAPGYQSVVVTLTSGRVLTGVRTAETDDELTLADSEGNKHVVRKSAVERRQPSEVSVMPEGLEKQFSVDEFVDLIAFLAGLKSGRAR